MCGLFMSILPENRSACQRAAGCPAAVTTVKIASGYEAATVLGSRSAYVPAPVISVGVNESAPVRGKGPAANVIFTSSTFPAKPLGSAIETVSNPLPALNALTIGDTPIVNALRAGSGL